MYQGLQVMHQGLQVLHQGLQVIVTDSEENPTVFHQASADGPSEDSTLHNVIGIQRRILANTTKLENEYYSDEDTDKFMDPVLYKAV